MMPAREIGVLPRVASVPHSWLSITGSLDAHAALMLHAAVEQAKVDPTDVHAVRTVWNALLIQAQRCYDDLQREAAEDHAAYRARASTRNKKMEALARLPIRR